MTQSELVRRLGDYCNRHHLERYEREGLLIARTDGRRGYTDKSANGLIELIRLAIKEQE